MSNKNRFTQCALAALILTPAAGFAADDISYSYIEGSYLVQDIDAYEDNDVFDDFFEDVDDGDGFGVNASVQLMDHMFIFGSYSQTEADFNFVEGTGFPVASGQDIKTLSLGAGFFMPINNRTDFVAKAAYMDMDVGEFSLGAEENDILDGDEDLETAWDDLNEDNTDGYFLDLGVRAQSFEWMELGGGVRYTDLDTGDQLSAFGNILFEINQHMGINLAADVGENLTTYKAGARFTF